MSGHTKEPWRPNRHAAMSIESGEGRGVCSCGGYQDNYTNGAYHDENEANARRIVDCVNALAGIPDPAAYVAAFEAMREALERLSANCIADEPALNAADTALQSARAAMGGQA